MSGRERGASCLALLVVAAAAMTCSGSPSPPPFRGSIEPPIIPVGLDAYRMWDRWPYLRVGMRAYVRSTYDRAGGNEAADASHFLRQDAPDHNVTLDLAGPGAMMFFRANYWHGSPWHYIVDGTDTVVSESSTADPSMPVPGAVFLPQASFPSPLTLTWSTTQGADLSWVPIPFATSLTLAYGRAHYGTGYYLYDLFPRGATNLSQPIAAWTGASPDPSVVALLASAGTDIAPPASAPGVSTRSGSAQAGPGTTATVVDLAGPATLRALAIDASPSMVKPLEYARLRISWDGRPLPSVDAPLPLLFATGTFFDRSGSTWLVKGLPVNVYFDGAGIHLRMYFPMPFQASAHVEVLAGPDPGGVAFAWQVRTQPYTDPPNWVGYFHATYRDEGASPSSGQDLTFLDTQLDEGGGPWCGQIAGTSFIFSDRGITSTLEGDPRFFFDDSQTPSVQGTGSEEWAGGGNYWAGGQDTTLPLAGHPVGVPLGVTPLGPDDLVESEYRFLLADLLPFGFRARVGFEHGGIDDSSDHYQSVVYWYGIPGACLEQSDSLHVGDATDEAAHAYQSPTASAVDTLTSRYEWGVDTFGGGQVYPATTDTGRHMTGTSQFTLSVDPRNLGVLLRRKLDYGYPDQRAEVYVADDSDTATYVDAGTWYLAGANTCLFMDPAGELDPAVPTGASETSDRRWRDDEFLIPRALTAGRSRVRVQIRFTPASHPLYPGAPAATLAWSEYRYTAYSWVMPSAP